MSKRIIWVVEVVSIRGNWSPIYYYDTREEARKHRMSFSYPSEFRVVKYVPAQEPKRVSKKAGVK